MERAPHAAARSGTYSHGLPMNDGSGSRIRGVTPHAHMSFAPDESDAMEPSVAVPMFDGEDSAPPPPLLRGTLEASEKERAEHPRCMPCSGMRLISSPMVLIVIGLVLLTWVPYVVLNPMTTTPARLCKVILTVLVLLTLASYMQVVFIDPGTVPAWFHEHAEGSPGVYQVCRKCNAYKPPRSHFDSVTGRLVLNMDHFCPWVANTVGFYNRKFFVLFLLYACASCLFAAATIALLFGDAVLPFGRPCRARGACHYSAPLLIALCFDTIFGVLLICFAGLHVHMAATNETTIETGCTYDVGMRKNWEQVFGSSPYLWFLPVWGGGPVGNGVLWPTR
ncbi:putative protein S-acyltransferase 12 [Diplonema papillatum]|nr:putative protein S-acyltransferase 12 [Diplonema papillatum]